MAKWPEQQPPPTCSTRSPSRAAATSSLRSVRVRHRWPIWSRLRLTQPQVSKHLGVLREVGVVRCRSVGRQRLYRVHAPALQPVHEWVSALEQQWNERFDRLDNYLSLLQANGTTS